MQIWFAISESIQYSIFFPINKFSKIWQDFLKNLNIIQGSWSTLVVCALPMVNPGFVPGKFLIFKQKHVHPELVVVKRMCNNNSSLLVTLREHQSKFLNSRYESLSFFEWIVFRFQMFGNKTDCHENNKNKIFSKKYSEHTTAPLTS